MQNDAQQATMTSHKALDHIDHCIGCNQCQKVCPSKVPFEALIDQFKSRHTETNPPALRLLLKAVKKPGGLNSAKKRLQIYKKSGLQKILQPLFQLTPFSASHQLLRFICHETQHQPKAVTTPRSVALFTGCSGQVFDQRTLNDTIKVLEYLNITVTIPENQYCCGALHQHNGFPEIARELDIKNTAQLLQKNIKQVIFTANGCGRQLKTSSSEIQYTDIMSFIYPYINGMKFKPLNEDIYIHYSCSNASLKDSSQLTSDVLGKIPGLQITDISENSCCGAGGSKLISQPALTEKLARDKIQQIKNKSPQYLLSDNIGCSLHFKQQLANAGIQVDVIHPVSLLAMQLG